MIYFLLISPLNAPLSGTLMLLPAVEAKTDGNLFAWTLHLGQAAGSSDLLIGRVTSKTFRHFGHKYS
jgi:hypothetical protein